MKKNLLLLTALFTGIFTLFAQPIYNEDGIRLYHTLSQEEIEWARSKGYDTLRIASIPPPVGELRPIAEFEPAEAVLIRYPFGIPILLIKEMAEYIKVITIVANASEQNTVLNQYNSNGVNTANCQFLIANTNTYWTRDYGPWFMAIDDSTVGIFDFTYNRPRPLDNNINTTLASYLSSAAGGGIQIDRYTSTLVLTGGNYMNDGIKQGFSTTLVLNENTGLSEQQIKDQYVLYLGIEQQHFIADAIYPYDNIQHIDCWGKLLSPNKVLIDSVAPSAPNYNKFQAAANYFRTQTSSWGMPYQVYRVFAPGATGTNPKTPYSNSLILNKKVFVPVSSSLTSNDNDALVVYQNAMPGYEIIPIPYNSWLNTDALHCRTHEIADRCMLYIKHQPLFGSVENEGYVTFSTELYSYCNNPMVSDSVIVYIKTSGSNEYVGYNMVESGNNTWTANVSGLPSGEINYYIFAKDESGRRECHPYIGAPDPHKFTLIGVATDLPIVAIDKNSSSVTSDSFEVIEDYITISNIGTADLTFEIKDIDFPISFTIEPMDAIIQPGGSQIIKLSYDFYSVENGEYTGRFFINTNDPVQPEIEIVCSASQNYTLLIPVLVIDSTKSSVFSDGHEVIKDSITISNIGNAELTFEITDIDFYEMLTIAPLGGTVQEDGSQIIILSYDFSDLENGTYYGSFILLSNDPEQSEIEITCFAYQNYVGIKETNVNTIYMYPNPASDKLNIVFNGEKYVKANIYNILGVELRELILTKGLNTIEIKELPSGIYFIKIAGNALKFVKQ